MAKNIKLTVDELIKKSVLSETSLLQADETYKKSIWILKGGFYDVEVNLYLKDNCFIEIIGKTRSQFDEAKMVEKTMMLRQFNRKMQPKVFVPEMFMGYKKDEKYYELSIASLENEEMKTQLPRRYPNSKFAKYLLYSPQELLFFSLEEEENVKM